jgi:hypothetical protein
MTIVNVFYAAECPQKAGERQKTKRNERKKLKEETNLCKPITNR